MYGLVNIKQILFQKNATCSCASLILHHNCMPICWSWNCYYVRSSGPGLDTFCKMTVICRITLKTSTRIGEFEKWVPLLTLKPEINVMQCSWNQHGNCYGQPKLWQCPAYEQESQLLLQNLYFLLLNHSRLLNRRTFWSKESSTASQMKAGTA